MISSTCAVSAYVVREPHVPFCLSCVTLSWPDANVWPHLATCCLDITSWPYTSMNCEWRSATDTLCPQKAYNSSEFQARPVCRVGHLVELMHLCLLQTCALNCMTLNTQALCCVCQQHLKFQPVQCLK
jgi:hypothetical protein